MARKFLLRIIPQHGLALRSIPPDQSWTHNPTYVNTYYTYLWTQPSWYTGALPYIDPGDSLFDKDLYTGEISTYENVASVAICNATPKSYVITTFGLIHINPGGVEPSGLKIYFYLNYISQVQYLLWYSSDILNFIDKPPALPYWLEQKITLQETLSSLESVRVVDTDLQITLANPIIKDQNGVYIRYWANVSRGLSEIMRVPIDDPSLSDSTVIVYQAQSNNPADFLYSPDHGSSIWQEVYSGKLRMPLETFNRLDRSTIALTLTRPLGSLERSSYRLDQFNRATFLQTVPERVPAVYGTKIIRGYLSNQHTTGSAQDSKLLWIKFCEGPIEKINWITINDSDPLLLSAFDSSGYGPLIDLSSGWVALPLIVLDPYLVGSLDDIVIKAEIVGKVNQSGTVDELEADTGVVVFDSDNPPVGLLDNPPITSYTNDPTLLWGNSNSIDSYLDLGGGEYALRMQCTGDNARINTTVRAPDIFWLYTARLFEIKFRITGTIPTQLELSFNALIPGASVKIQNINGAGGDWQTLRVLLHPDKMDLPTGETIFVNQDSWAIAYAADIYIYATGSDGTTVIDFQWFKFYRPSAIDSPPDVSRNITYEGSFETGNELPDGIMAGQGLDAIRVADSAVWTTDVPYVGANSLKLQPYDSLRLKLPTSATGSDKIWTLAAVPDLQQARNLPLCLWNTGQAIDVVDPSAGIRQTEMVAMLNSCGTKFFQKVSTPLSSTGGTGYLAIQYIPFVFPCLKVSSAQVNPYGSLPEQFFGSMLRVGDLVSFVPIGADGIEYQPAAVGSGSALQFEIVSINIADKYITINESVNLIAGYGLVLNIPLNVSGISVKSAFVNVPEQTRNLLDIINISGVIESENNVNQILSGIYQDTGLLPTPGRDGKLTMKVIGASSNLYASALLANAEDHNYDPDSLIMQGDADRLWFNIVNAEGSYDPVTGAFMVDTALNVTDLFFPQPLELVQQTKIMVWRNGLTAVRNRAKALLHQAQRVRGFGLVLIGPLVQTLRAGDVLVFSFPELNIFDRYSIVRTITEETSGDIPSAKVSLAALNPELSFLPETYRSGGAKYNSENLYC